MWMVMLLIMMKLTVLMKQQNAQVTDLSQATKDQNSWKESENLSRCIIAGDGNF